MPTYYTGLHNYCPYAGGVRGGGGGGGITALQATKLRMLPTHIEGRYLHTTPPPPPPPPPPLPPSLLLYSGRTVCAVSIIFKLLTWNIASNNDEHNTGFQGADLKFKGGGGESPSPLCLPPLCVSLPSV